MSPQHGNLTRRNFMQTTAAMSAAAMLASLGTNFAHAAGSDQIRIGLVGCGGRGTGAVKDCLTTNEGVQIVALGDMFNERIADAVKTFTELGPDKFAVKTDNCFTGFDAYQKVIASDVNYVILATPPGFRPLHIKAAVEAGKNVFAEKPVAVDPVGARMVMDAAKLVQQKKLAFVAGTQRRHDDAYIQTLKRIHDGAIGDLVAGQCYWNQGYLWMKPREPAWSDMEWQLRNWLYFTWLSGDHIVEQHVHNMDVMNWCFGGPPSSAYGMGGRQVRTDPAFGHIYDHFAVEYQYPNGARVQSMCRQIDGTDSRVAERIVGTRGDSDSAGHITGPSPYRFEKTDKTRNPYEQEHIDLVASIRSGNPLNEARRIAESTLTAIMGRMSAYSGKEVTWETAMKSELSLMPEKLELGPLPLPPVAMPGKEKLV